MQKIILYEVRFNPCEVRLNWTLENLETLRKVKIWNFVIYRFNLRWKRYFQLNLVYTRWDLWETHVIFLYLIRILVPCSTKGCEHLCVTENTDTATCLCRNGYDLDSDGRTCKGDSWLYEYNIELDYVKINFLFTFVGVSCWRNTH